MLRAARESVKGQVIAVVQPHRYTRLSSLFEQFSTCFNDADTVIVAHVYAAGEAPIPGADRDALVQALRAHGHRQAIPLDGAQDLARIDRAAGASRATSWCASAPATSRNGPMRCRASSPRSVRSHEGERARAGAGGSARSGRRAEGLHARAARAPPGQPAARRADLVPRRRAGAGAVHAGGRGRSRLFPAHPAGAMFR